MSIHYLHIILLSLITIIFLRVSLSVKNMSDLEQNKICIAFNDPSAKNSIRPLCKVEYYEQEDHCYSQLSYLKNDKMINDSCKRYLAHISQFPNSSESVQPRNFLAISTLNPISQLPQQDLPFYFLSKEEEIQTLQALVRETEVHYIQAKDAKDYDVSEQSTPTNHTDLTINIDIDLPITLVLENLDYVNWNLTGKIHNVKAIFVKNSQHTTLSKDINLDHIYTSKLKNSICTQCRGLHLQEVSFNFRETPYSEAFVVQNFNPHVRVRAKTIIIKDNSHMDYSNNERKLPF